MTTEDPNKGSGEAVLGDWGLYEALKPTDTESQALGVTSVLILKGELCK
ncbi:hypothetical protein HBO37_20475 [Pseudomonas proteolytica]|nr:hypothetical protein [Pseudomonas proteolytica]NMZ07730.1 hypothetical protein [Pseudomonas proteolytica]